MDKIKSCKNMFNTTVESIINSVEAIHKAISDISFKNVDICFFQEEIGQLKQNRDNYVSGIYSVVRSINMRIGETVDYIIEQLEKSDVVEKYENLQINNQ